MSLDLFTKARLKITFLYFLLGIVILAIAGYLIYADFTAIIRNMLETLQALAMSGKPLNETMAANVIAQTLDTQIQQMDIIIGVWIIIAMVLSAYLLAGLTLRPVRRAMERQKRFMANISHELRTPLSVMRTSTEATLLGGEAITRAELIAAKESDIEEIDRMAKILDFLFSFSNIENRLHRLIFSPIDLAEIARKSVALVDPRAKEKQVSLTVSTEPAIVMGDATALEEVVINLIKNAISYTPSGGAVRVIVASRYGTARISVEDTGIGIPTKDIGNIFDAFYRGENTLEHKQEGSSGLGLAIVKEIAIFHNAKIFVESSLGKGTRFTLRFPSRISRWLTPWN
jgi:OmpR-family two-component system manganese-sensing sensor histidine kinase